MIFAGVVLNAGADTMPAVAALETQDRPPYPLRGLEAHRPLPTHICRLCRDEQGPEGCGASNGLADGRSLRPLEQRREQVGNRYVAALQ